MSREHSWDILWEEQKHGLKVEATSPTAAKRAAKARLPRTGTKIKFYPHLEGCNCPKWKQPCWAWELNKRLGGTPLARLANL